MRWDEGADSDRSRAAVRLPRLLMLDSKENDGSRWMD